MSNEEQEEYVEIADSEAMRRINFYALLDELEMYMRDDKFRNEVIDFVDASCTG